MGLTVVAGLLAPAAATAQPFTAPQSSASQGQSALTHDKSKSPPTDLLRYPKRETAAETERERHAKSYKLAAGENESKQVLAEQPLPDGATRYTSYTPAKGVAPEQLAAKLRRTGVNAEVVTQDGSGDGISAFAGMCAYGIARTLTCPPKYWRNNGYDDPQVYFIDHSSWQWPTDQAVYTWNQSYGIDSYYAWGGCPGYGGTHCIDVWSGNYGPGWSGLTTWVANSDGSFVELGSLVQLNDYYSYSGTQRRSNVCHELGHALGLGHAVGGGSCMNPYRGDYPHSDDFFLLADIYSIYR